jgi:hypothetical protein
MLVIVVRCTKRHFRLSVLRIRRQSATSCIAQNLNHRSIAGACSCKSPLRTAGLVDVRAEVATRDGKQNKHKEAQTFDDDPSEPFGAIGDERLRLTFTCCHPALAMETRVALTLRMVGGLTVAEVAGLPVQKTSMGRRITRAKVKIKAARIPFWCYPREDLLWPMRIATPSPRTILNSVPCSGINRAWRHAIFVGLNTPYLRQK